MLGGIHISSSLPTGCGSGQSQGVGITPKQFAELTNRVRGVKRPAADTVKAPPSGPAAHSILLGVDPSLRGTGYGVIQMAKPHPIALAYGTIHCPAGWARSRCLLLISQTLREVIRKHSPDVCAVEGLFFAQNLQTALIMGEARGAALAVVAEAGLEIYEHAPRRVKQAVVGYGAAQKMAVAKMVQRMLRLSELPAADAADALAVALTHAQESTRFSLSPAKKV